MRVAFDGAPLDDGPALGAATAFLAGLRAYAGLASPPPVLLLPHGARDPSVPGVDVLDAPRGALRRQWALPRLLRRLNAHVLHSPVASVPLCSPCPTIATVHDLPWLAAGSGERTGPWRRFATARALRSADAVLAPSRFTFGAAERLLGSRTRLHLVPHGVPAAAPPEVAARDGPMLALGDDRPRKNRQRVAAAAARAREQDRAVPELVFVGPPHRVVDDAEKCSLLRRCRALVHCATFEGFGLPVLEGLAHGAPVLCADLPPLREIAGDAALFVDPLDVAAIADGMLRICRDAALRARLSAAGPARAAAFRPEDVALAWQRLHRELVR
jgi:glycosyltransferase involved in cell wall biosynthesis